MKKFTIICREYDNRGIVTRESQETYTCPAERFRRADWETIHGEHRRGRGPAENWMYALRSVHYTLTRDNRVSSVQLQRNLSVATLIIDCAAQADCGAVMYDVVHDFRAHGFPV